MAREACARARACGRTLAAEVAAAAAAVAERRRAEESRWTEAAERRGGGKDLTHELRACHRGETRPRGPGVGMCWDEACDYCDEKIYYDYMWSIRVGDDVTWLRHSVGPESEKSLEILRYSYVSCVLFSYFPFLNFRHVVRAPGLRTATSDDRRRHSCLV